MILFQYSYFIMTMGEMIYFFFSFFLMHLESCMVSKEYLKINET